MGSVCVDPADIVGETPVLGLDLLGFSAGHTKDLARGLRKKEVEKEIKKTLDAEKKKLMALQLHGPVSPKKAQQSLKKVGEAMAKAVTEDAKNKLGRWAECTWKQMPLGIWVDENDWVMYIVVPVVISAGAGAAAYMYEARVGDKPANLGASLLKKHLRFKPIGSLELGVEDLSFTPSKRDFEVKFFSSQNWKPLRAKFTLGGGVSEGKVSKANASSALTYKGIGSALNLDLTFKTFIDYRDDTLSFGGSGQAKYKFKAGDIPFAAGAEAAWKGTLGPTGGMQNEGKLMFTLSADLF